VSIRLTTIEQGKPQITVSDENPIVTPEESFLYKDLDFDLELASIYGNFPVNKPKNTVDLKDLRNGADVKQALENLFNTTPGQRLTNPAFGLNLSRFLFDPITKITGDLIGRSISAGIGRFEPRVAVSNIHVLGFPSQGMYQITLSMNYVDKQLGEVTLRGNLTSDGFKFNNII